MLDGLLVIHSYPSELDLLLPTGKLKTHRRGIGVTNKDYFSQNEDVNKSPCCQENQSRSKVKNKNRWDDVLFSCSCPECKTRQLLKN